MRNARGDQVIRPSRFSQLRRGAFAADRASRAADGIGAVDTRHR
jgi:hypothetical protein